MEEYYLEDVGYHIFLTGCEESGNRLKPEKFPCIAVVIHMDTMRIDVFSESGSIEKSHDYQSLSRNFPESLTKLKNCIQPDSETGNPSIKVGYTGQFFNKIKLIAGVPTFHKPTWPLTNWDIVKKASDDNLGGKDWVYRQYTGPLKHFLAGVMGLPQHQAKELAHEFFILHLKADNQKSVLKKANPDKGRFHSYLCLNIKHFAIDQLRKLRTKTKQSQLITRELSLRQFQASDCFQKEKIEWSIVNEVFEECINALKHESRQKGKDEWWLVFKYKCYDPFIHNHPPKSFEQIAEIIGGEVTARSASNYYTHAKRKLQSTFRNVINQHADKIPPETIAWLKSFDS